MTFQIGAQAYNALNHVNFAAPQNNASNLSTLGHISSDVNAPTSPYGSSQEPTVAGRVLVVQGRFLFRTRGAQNGRSASRAAEKRLREGLTAFAVRSCKELFRCLLSQWMLSCGFVSGHDF